MTEAVAVPTGDEHDFLAGGGEMAKLIRAKDWSSTPLGSIETWPQSLRTTVSLCLASNFPINIIWGPDNTQIYNDGYRVVCGEAHPHALGEGYDVTWASAWPAIGAPFERARAGDTSFLENQRMFLMRNGYLEETFFTFSLSPIRDESGGIGGLFHPVTETTGTMLAERRTRALRDLTAKLATAADLGELASFTVETLAMHELDLPFVLFYERDGRDPTYRLVGQHGVAAETAGIPHLIGEAEPSGWPVAEALRSGRLVEVRDVGARLRGAACGPYEEPPERAFLIPVSVPGAEAPPVLVVLGVSPRLPLSSVYRDFYGLVAAALSAALATVRAREDERRRAQALAEIDRAKTAFFSNVSHEFRTPLTLLLGPLEELLANAGELGADELERVTLAHRNGQRLLKLVNMLLDFARLEAGRAEASYEPTDIAALTAELASNFRSAIERAGMALVVEAEPLSEPAYLDPAMWEKVVLNLLSNAFKFTHEGEIRVTVRPSANGKAVEVTVADTGIGIPVQELARLFERFHRVAGAQGRSVEGSGIGLALVQELVKLHGGAMAVSSEPGRGSAFTVTLPLGAEHLPRDRIRRVRSASPDSTRARPYVEEALSWLPEGDKEEAEASPARPAGPRVSEHVLLAEDNADMRAYVAGLLRAAGFSVETAGNGEAALAAARARVPDLILSDVMMPGLDGFGLLAALRADPALKNTPFVLLSARAGEEARAEGIEAGADDYLTKPFSARELVARVAATLNLARDRQEAGLRESEARFRLTADAVPQIVWVTDAQGRTEFFNRQWFAYTGTELAPRTAAQVAERFVHPEDIELTMSAFERAQRHGAPFQVEHRIRGASGDYRWFLVRAEPYRDPSSGEIIRWFGASADIHDRREVEARLAFSEEQLRLATESAEIGLWDLDCLTDTLFWPALVKAMFGISPHVPVTMRDFFNGVHPDDAARIVEAFEAARDPERRALYDVEYRTIGKEDGVLRWVAAKGRGLFTPEGVCTRVIGTAIDITARKASEMLLRELNEDLELRVAERTAERNRVWELSRDLLAVMGFDGHLKAINPAWESTLGFDAETLLSLSFKEQVHPDDHAAVHAVMERLLRGETVARFEDRIRHADGSWRWISWALVPEGDVFYAVGRDVTAEKSQAEALALAEDQLRQSQKLEAVGQLTGGVAHDFNNLLTVIRGSVEMLQRPNLSQERHARYVAAIRETSDRAAKLTGQLLAFARRQALKPEVFQPAASVQSLSEMLGTLTGSRVTLDLRLPETGCWVDADPSQFDTALINMAVNARDAMNGEGPLTIEVKPVSGIPAMRGQPSIEGDFVAVVLADTGAGMPAETLDRIFEPFYTTKAVGHGTGLGLSQVFGFVKQSGGEVEVRSQPGQGATFILYLPRVHSAMRDDAREASPPLIDGQGACVLLVEDNEDVGAFATQALTELGYNTVLATDGAAALAELQKGDEGFDVVFSDVVMPGMDGVELGREIRRRHPDLPILLTSGYSHVLAQNGDHGFELLHKPYSIEELSRVLGKTAAWRRSRRGPKLR